jgi:hypothetical protein
VPSAGLVPHDLAASDVLGTGWFARGRRRDIHPGRVFDLTLPLEDAAEGSLAMHERRAIKTLLTV